MNNISGIQYPFKARTNQFALRQKLAEKMPTRRFFVTFKRAKTASMFRMAIAVVVAVVLAIALTLVLAACALYFIA